MRIIMIAGPNGAGKSTLAAEYLEREGGGPHFINGDDIAARLNPQDPAAAAQQAGRIALRQMSEYVAGGMDFVVETTLSGRAYAARIRRWRAEGYRVAIIYLRLPSADQAVERVARRVREGGHHIPEDVIRRRFARSWTNFLSLYRQVADEWGVYDNSVRPALLLDQSDGWQGVREGRSSDRLQGEALRDSVGGTTGRTQRYQPTGRSMMTVQPGRIPEGEPSVKSVLAALERAQIKALERAAAVDGANVRQQGTDDGNRSK